MIEFPHFVPSQRLKKAAAKAMFGTAKWCEARKGEVETIVAAAEAEGNEILALANTKADEVIAAAKQDAIDNSGRFLTELQARTEAQSSEDAASLAKALAELESDLVNLLEQSLDQLFEMTAPADLLEGIIRRVMVRHHAITGLEFRVSEEFRPVLRTALDAAGFGNAAIPIRVDPHLKGDDCLLEGPLESVDIAPRAQVMVMLDNLREASGHVSD